MADLIIPILFWISIPLSLALSVIGILKNKYWLILIGALLFIPVSYYINGSPSVNGYGLFLPIFQVISSAAVREGKKLWAWLFLLPAFYIVIRFILFILIYHFSSR